MLVQKLLADPPEAMAAVDKMREYIGLVGATASLEYHHSCCKQLKVNRHRLGLEYTEDYSHGACTSQSRFG